MLQYLIMKVRGLVFIHLVIMNTRLGEIYTNFIRIIVILFWHVKDTGW